MDTDVEDSHDEVVAVAVARIRLGPLNRFDVIGKLTFCSEPSRTRQNQLQEVWWEFALTLALSPGRGDAAHLP
jgi:hypothetical protein